MSSLMAYMNTSGFPLTGTQNSKSSSLIIAKQLCVYVCGGSYREPGLLCGCSG